MTTAQKTAKKQALSRAANGRFAKQTAKLTSTRRTRSAQTSTTKLKAKKATRQSKQAVAKSRLPRVSQLKLPAAPKYILGSVEVSKDTAISRAQWIAIGAVANLAALATGLITGWFLGVA